MLLASNHRCHRDVADMYEIPALPAILKHARSLAPPKSRGKDGRYTGITRVARHAGPVDIVVAHGENRSAGNPCPVAAVKLLRNLAAGVGISRIERCSLADKCRFEWAIANRAWRFELARLQCA